MTQFRYAHGGGKDWREAAQSVATQLAGASGTLGFLYVTDVIAAQLPDILSMCRKATGVPHWVGTVGLGVCATGHEYLDEPAVAAMLGDFEADAFKVFSGITDADDVRKIELRCGGSQAAFAIVHADPTSALIS